MVNNNDNNGKGAKGNEVDDDGDGSTGNNDGEGATGNDVGDDGDSATGDGMQR